MADPKPDVGLYFACVPPLIVPLSARAKEKLPCGAGFDAVMFLEDSAEEVLATFPPDWVAVALEDFDGNRVKLLSIKVLH